LAADAPPPPGQPEARPAAYVAAEKKLVRHLLDKLGALPPQTLGGYERRILEGMTRVDLEQAYRWLDERRKRGEAGADDKSGLAQALRIAAAEKAAARDPAEAVMLLAPLPAAESHRVLLGLARRYRAADPAKALRRSEERRVGKEGRFRRSP